MVSRSFVIANDGDDDKIVIFGTENSLQHLAEVDTFFVDGMQFETGATQMPRRRKVRDREKRLQNIFDRFRTGSMTIDEYLEAIKHHAGFK